MTDVQITVVIQFIASCKDHQIAVFAHAAAGLYLFVDDGIARSGSGKIGSKIVSSCNVQISVFVDVIEVNIHFQSIGTHSHYLFIERSINVPANVLRFRPMTIVHGTLINVAAPVSIDLDFFLSDVVFPSGGINEVHLILVNERIIIRFGTVDLFTQVLKADVYRICHHLKRVLALFEIVFNFICSSWFEKSEFFKSNDCLVYTIAEQVSFSEVNEYVFIYIWITGHFLQQ